MVGMPAPTAPPLAYPRNPSIRAVSSAVNTYPLPSIWTISGPRSPTR